jgi:hypothetical protein
LREFPVLTESASYLDVVEVELRDDGVSFRRVVTPSGYRTWDGILSRQVVESADFHALCDAVMAEGGNWQIDFGGLVRIAVPPRSTLDPEARIQAIASGFTGDPIPRTSRSGASANRNS